MQQTPQDRKLRIIRLVLLFLMWVIVLSAIGLLWPESPLSTARTVVRRLREAAGVGALAAAAIITWLSSDWITRKAPQPARRIQLGLITFITIYGVSAAVGARTALVALGIAFPVGLLAAGLLVLLPRFLAPPLPTRLLDNLGGDRERLEAVEARAKLQNDIRTTLLQAIGGLAVLAGAVLAFQQLSDDRQQANATQELTRQGQASERFTQAVDQLGNKRPEVQLGGIYGLEQVARQAPDNRLAVTEVLVAYLQRRTPRPAKPSMPAAETLRVRAPEIQAAVTVLLRRQWVYGDPQLDLSGLDLRRAEFTGQQVQLPVGIEIRPGTLDSADFRDADLRGAEFAFVHLSGADFSGADLRGADLHLADPSNPYGTGPPGIETAKFHGALADKSTKWPDGFDWSAKGVKTP